MSETYPVVERIVQAVVAALEAILKANNYATNVSQVVRPRRTGEMFVPTDKGVAVIQDDERPAPEHNVCGNPPVIGWRLPIACDLVVRVSESATEPMDQVLNIFKADVQKALMQDPQWGGLAINSELGPAEYPDPSKGVEGVTVWIDIEYRVAENDPYTNMS